MNYSNLLWCMLVLSSVVNAAEHAYFDSDGVELHYISSGSGETVVLLHGFSGSAEGLYLRPGTLAALTEAGYHVVALDQRGHGKSTKPYASERYGLHMVEDVRRLLDHLQVEKAHLIGYSMGSKVANTFRSHYPERLLTVVLGGYGWPWQTPQMTDDEAELRMANRTLLPGNDREALTAVSMGMYLLMPAEDDLRNNDVPALAIIGDKDSVVPAADFSSLRSTMSNLITVSMPGTHAGPDGAPYKPQYAAEIIKFLSANQK